MGELQFRFSFLSKKGFSQMGKKTLWIMAGLGMIVHLATFITRFTSLLPYPMLSDFASFYAGAWSLRLHQDPYPWPNHLQGYLAIHSGFPGDLILPQLNSFPLWPWMLRPFTYIHFPVACWVWIALNLGILGICIHYLAQRARISSFQKVLFLYLVVLIFGPVSLSITLGQTSVLVLLLALMVGESLKKHKGGITFAFFTSILFFYK